MWVSLAMLIAGIVLVVGSFIQQYKAEVDSKKREVKLQNNLDIAQKERKHYQEATEKTIQLLDEKIAKLKSEPALRIVGGSYRNKVLTLKVQNFGDIQAAICQLYQINDGVESAVGEERRNVVKGHEVEYLDTVNIVFTGYTFKKYLLKCEFEDIAGARRTIKFGPTTVALFTNGGPVKVSYIADNG